MKKLFNFAALLFFRNTGEAGHLDATLSEKQPLVANPHLKRLYRAWVCLGLRVGLFSRITKIDKSAANWDLAATPARTLLYNSILCLRRLALRVGGCLYFFKQGKRFAKTYNPAKREGAKDALPTNAGRSVSLTPKEYLDFTPKYEKWVGNGKPHTRMISIES